MITRRAFLRVLGLVPIVGPAVVRAMAAAPAAATPLASEWIYTTDHPLLRGEIGQWSGVMVMPHEALPVFHSEAVPGAWQLSPDHDPPASVLTIDEALDAQREWRPFTVVSPNMYELLRSEPGFVDVERS